MIVSIADKETEAIWSGKRSRKLPADIQSRALAKLAMLDAAADLDDLTPRKSTACAEGRARRPTFHFH